MPQGEGSSSGGQVKTLYAKKRSAAEVKKGGANVGLTGMALQNLAFKAGLGKMISDIEAIAAAKLVKSGAAVQLSDLKRIGQGEIRTQGKKRARVNAVTSVLTRGRNLKGVRGEIDVDELAELDPELKAYVDHRKATAGGGGKKSGGGAGAGGGSGHRGSGPIEATAPAVVVRRTGPIDPTTRPRGVGKVAAARANATGGTAKRIMPNNAAEKPASAGGLFASDAQVAAQFGADFA
jgi:hypothetical protein